MDSYKKKFCIVLLLILLINFCVCGSVNASTVLQEDDMYSIDIDSVLKYNQETLARLFINSLESTGNTVNINQFKTYCEQYNVYFTYYGNKQQGYNRIRAYFYIDNIDFINMESDNINTKINYFYDYYMLIPTTGFNLDASQRGVSNSCIMNISTSGYWSGSDTSVMYLPTLLIYYNNETVNNYLNGIKPNSNYFNVIIETIQENTEQQAETTEEIKKLNDFMKDTSSDDSDFSINTPSIGGDDTGINNVFTAIRNAFTNEQNYSSGIQIPLPYMNTIVTIPGNMMYQVSQNHRELRPVIAIVNAYWYFIVSMYIVRDVYGYMKAAKEGELDEIKESDIKTEVL